MTAHSQIKAAAQVRSPMVVAQALYDEPRDLEAHEQRFLADVHRITMHCARTKGEAARAWGGGSRAAAAVAFLADSKCVHDLARALERYDAAHEAFLEPSATTDNAQYAREIEATRREMERSK